MGIDRGIDKRIVIEGLISDGDSTVSLGITTPQLHFHALFTRIEFESLI